MKIALVNPLYSPKYPNPPMGLAQIAAVLEAGGHSVGIIDANALVLKPEETARQAASADVVGLTAMTPAINSAINIARLVKKLRPDVPLVLGGAHATLMPEETLRSAPEIDLLVSGEGEDVVLPLIASLSKKESPAAIPGLSYRVGGQIRTNPRSGASVNLDALPFLAYHLLPLDRYRPHPPHGRRRPYAALLTSRGCPFQCSYCSKPIFGRKFRAQSPQRVVAEVEHLRDRFGVQELAFYDDVFTLNRERAAEICELMLSRGLKMVWTCETRVDLVNRDLLKLMKKAGCYAVAIGVESGSEKILEQLHKGITYDQVRQAVGWSREVGLEVAGYFMVGCPGETRETILQTINLAKKLDIDYAQFAVTTPFPGTELYRQYLAGVKEQPKWEDFVYEGLNGRVTPTFESGDLDREALRAYTSRAYREFYLRPGYIWRRLSRIRSPGDLVVNLKGLALLLGSLK